MVSYGLNELLADLEGDAEKRRAELEIMKRAIESASDAGDEEVAAALRRSFVLLAYAHAEGGVRYALESYVRLLNDQKMTIEQCNPHIVASAWDALFGELANTGAKAGRYFKGDPGGDSRLHIYARRVEFIVRRRELETECVVIPDGVVNTESNVDQVVLSKLLFQLGLPREWDWDRAFRELIMLKALRNRIAHGEIEPVLPEKCSACEQAALTTLSKLRKYLERSVIDESFRRDAKPAA